MVSEMKEETVETWKIQTHLLDASGREWIVSTVRLMFADPLRFETLVFRAKHGEPEWARDETQRQYDTEEEAREGHWDMIAKVRKWKK